VTAPASDAIQHRADADAAWKTLGIGIEVETVH
jgi:hypothetical protein